MIYVHLVYILSLLVSISIISSYIANSSKCGNSMKKICQGILFAAVTVISMLNPFVFSPGIVFDGRSVILSLASFFFGPLTMIISCISAFIFRIIRGGDGAMTGILVIVSSSLIGYVYADLLKKKHRETRVKDVFFMSILVHIAMILLMFTLPAKVSIATIKTIALPVLLIYPLASVLIGKVFIDQSSSRRVLSDLRKSEFTLQKIFEILPIGLWFADKNGKPLRGNSAAVNIWGADPQVGMEEYKVFKARRIPSMEEIKDDDWALNHTINEGITVKDELLEIDSFDGKKKIILNYTAPIKNENNEILGAIGVNQDVTESVKAEEQLRKSETILKETQKISKIGGWEWDVEKDNMYWTDEVFAIHGMNHENSENSTKELIALSTECYKEDAGDRIMEAFNKCVTEGTPYDLISPFRSFDNRDMFIRTSAYAERKNGRIVRVIGNIMDITEQVIAEKTIAEEKELLRVTLKSIGDGVITTDIVGRIITMNEMAEILTGWSFEEAKGKFLSDVFIVIDEDRREINEDLALKIIKSNSIVTPVENMILVTKSKNDILISQSGAPIRNQNNEVVGAVIVFRDMTEKKKANESIQRSDKLNALGTLAGGIAHDFNNLLNGIFGYIDLAKRSAGENEDVKNYLEDALKTFSRAKDLTRQILTFSKGGDPVKMTHSVAKLIRESSKFASSGSKVSIKTNIQDNLFNSDIDENQISQAINNLIINAQQAMPLGGVIEINAKNIKGYENHITQDNNKDFIQISIRDEGVGIPSSVLPHIFDPFFTTKQNGTGLGLAMVYSIIKKHGGYIDVESKINAGTSFHIFLPASKEQPKERKKISMEKPARAGRILIMDDEASIRETTEKLLESMGFEVLTTENGETALKILKEVNDRGLKIDAVILDLTVPGGMGGKDIIIDIRKTNPDTIIIASSGYSEDPVMSNPGSFGFTDSIAKPYRINQLLETLSKHLNFN